MDIFIQDFINKLIVYYRNYYTSRIQQWIQCSSFFESMKS